MKKNIISRKSQTDWARLKTMTDDEIDFSDSPELTPDQEDFTLVAEDLFLALDREEAEYLQAASKNEAFDFLKEPNEDIYSLHDGKPLPQ